MLAPLASGSWDSVGEAVEAMGQGVEVGTRHREDDRATVEVGLRQEAAAVPGDVEADARHGLDGMGRGGIAGSRRQAERGDAEVTEPRAALGEGGAEQSLGHRAPAGVAGADEGHGVARGGHAVTMRGFRAPSSVQSAPSRFSWRWPMSRR